MTINTDAILVGTYSFRACGKRGITITIPSSFVKDSAMKPTDFCDVYRTLDEKLILIPHFVGEQNV